MADQNDGGVEQRVLEIFDKVASSISPVDKLALGIVSLGGAVGGFLLPVMQSAGLIESRLSVGFTLAHCSALRPPGSACSFSPIVALMIS
jgi:hypothetical protein